MNIATRHPQMPKNLTKWFLLLAICTLGTVQAQTFNFTCDFEHNSDISGWEFQNPTVNKWVIGSAMNHTPNGSKSLYISSQNNGNLAEYNFDIPTFNGASKLFTLPVGQYTFSFDWIVQGESYSPTMVTDYLRVALIPATSTLPTSLPNNFDRRLPSEWVALDGGKVLYNTSTWKSQTFQFEITDANDYRLAFFWINDKGGGANPAAIIDNITLKASSCAKPTQLHLVETTTNSAILDWATTDAPNAWVLEYGPSGFTPSKGSSVKVTHHPFTLTHLADNTQYDVYLSSVCASDEVSASTLISFTTACHEVALPIAEDFESVEFSSLPSCWRIKEGNVQVKNAAWSAYSGSNALSLAADAVVISPKFSVAGNKMTLKFAAKQSYSGAGTLEIGFVSDIEAWDYQTVKILQPTTDAYQEYEVSFDSLSKAKQHGYIVLKQKSLDGWSDWLIDKVSVF